MWKVDSDFVQMLYTQEHDFKLKFVVYFEKNYNMQLFPLMKPSMRKKARDESFKAVKKLKEMKRGKSVVQEVPDGKYEKK